MNRFVQNDFYVVNKGYGNMQIAEYRSEMAKGLGFRVRVRGYG